jgi:hypothetical protein
VIDLAIFRSGDLVIDLMIYFVIGTPGQDRYLDRGIRSSPDQQIDRQLTTSLDHEMFRPRRS